MISEDADLRKSLRQMMLEEGMVVSAKALLDRHPDPSEDQVREVLAGHFCRCTGYKKPVEAVLAAAAAGRKPAVEVLP